MKPKKNKDYQKNNGSLDVISKKVIIKYIYKQSIESHN